MICYFCLFIRHGLELFFSFIMTNHLTGVGPPLISSPGRLFTEFPNKFKPTNVLLKTTHGHVMRACDDMQVRYLNSL